MHKVININIGGRIFQVEETAFEVLNHYIDSLKRYFGGKPEGAEIVADIENRIAELLQAKLKDKPSITAEEVNEIITSMGTPEAIAGDETETKQEQEQEESDTRYETSSDFGTGRSKIYRDPDGKVIGGVCSGLAYYFDMDSTIVRLIFVALFFAGGSSVFIYIILFIVIPEAKSTAEKLAMRKERINVDTIRKSVEGEFNRVKSSIEKGDYQGHISNFFQRIFHIIGMVIKAFVKFFAFLAGLFFAFMAISLFIGMISIITGSTIMNGQHIGLFDPVFFSFFDNADDRILSQIAVVLGLFAFILIFFNMSRALLTPGRSMANKKFFNRLTGTVFILALVLCIISLVKTVSYFRSEGTVEQKLQLDSTRNNFHITTFHSKRHGVGFFLENDSLKIRDIELKIELTEGKAEMLQVVESRGQDYNKARENASNCVYEIQIKDSMIVLPESFTLKNNQAYRKQKITFILRLPVGSRFTIDRSAHLDINGQTVSYDYIRRGETYEMKSEGIHCLNCDTYGVALGVEEDYEFSYHTGNFVEVHASSHMKIRIVKGNTTKVLANGLDNESDLVVKSDGGELDVHLKRTFFDGFDSDVEVMIVTPDLKNVKLDGAVNAEIEGFDNQKMDISCSGASSCDARLTAVSLTAEVTGASELIVSGSAVSLNLDAAGASKVDVSDLKVQDVTVEASGASNVELYASRSLRAEASGASNIFYYGNPVTVDSKATGAGKILRK